MRSGVFSTAFAVLSLALTASVFPSVPAGAAPKKPAAAAQTVRIRINGMHCEGCAKTISDELKKAPGVSRAEITYVKKLGAVTLNPAKTSAAKVTKTIQGLGYEAAVLK